MKKRKVTSILLFAALSLSFIACNENKKPNVNNRDNPNAPAKENPEKTKPNVSGDKTQQTKVEESTANQKCKTEMNIGDFKPNYKLTAKDVKVVTQDSKILVTSNIKINSIEQQIVTTHDKTTGEQEPLKSMSLDKKLNVQIISKCEGQNCETYFMKIAIFTADDAVTSGGNVVGISGLVYDSKLNKVFSTDLPTDKQGYDDMFSMLRCLMVKVTPKDEIKKG